MRESEGKEPRNWGRKEDNVKDFPLARHGGVSHMVTIGDIPSLERVHAYPNGKFRFEIQ